MYQVAGQYSNNSSIQIRKKFIIEVICFLFIFLFVYAAFSKLTDFNKFKAQLGQSPMLTAYASLVAFAIPISEVLISIMLVISKLRLLALYMSFSLMTMFTTYIIAITNFSEFVPCSCGGVLQNMTWNQHLLFNIFFMLLGIAGVFLMSSLHATDTKHT
jgi:uncharacterized membrane protein YphA (DoxX/SURF4 family)